MSNSTDEYVYIISVKNQFNIIDVISLLTAKQFYIKMPFLFYPLSFKIKVIIYFYEYQFSFKINHLQMSSVST